MFVYWAVLMFAVFCGVSAEEDDSTTTNCDAIDPPEFGNVTYSLGDDGEQKAAFDCTYGYILEGPSLLTCLGDHWNYETPVCVLDVFDGMGSSSICHPETPTDCTYVNDARNPVMWQVEEQHEEEDGTTTVTTEEAPAVLLRCESQYCPKSYTGRRRRAPKKMAVPYPAHYMNRRDTNDVRSEMAVLKIPASRRRSPAMVTVRTNVELGKFDTSPSNSYLKFTATGSPDAVAQQLEVVAHCLPDPPGHLDHLSASDIEIVTMPLLGTSQTKCLKLKDRVQRCTEFSIRFSLFVVHHNTQSVTISLRSKSTHSTMTAAQCPGNSLLNND